MKKRLTAGLIAVITILIAAQSQAVGKTSYTIYGTYWDGSAETGYGAGLKVTRSLLDMLYLDGRASYITFDTSETDLIPLEIGMNLGLPGMITPYAGVGAGYYIIDSPVLESRAGLYGQIGVEFTLSKIGALAELRYHDLEGTALDDLSVNFGILLKF